MTNLPITLGTAQIGKPCQGCINVQSAYFSDIESEEELNHKLLDHYLDRSRSAKRKEITDRPCYHGLVCSENGSINVAALLLSHDLFDKVDHLPPSIQLTEKCSLDNFYDFISCERGSDSLATNLIVFRLIPEDIEDEPLFDLLHLNSVDGKFVYSYSLQCELFKKLFVFPLLREKEPPGFLNIESRVNLESAPREDNVLLGILFKKLLQKEEGELSDIESVQDFPDNFSFSPEVVSNGPPSPTSPSKSLVAKSPEKSGGISFTPQDCYGSFINLAVVNAPFLTDSVDSVDLKKRLPKTSSSTRKADAFSSDSDSSCIELISSPSPTDRKRSFSTSQSSAKTREANFKRLTTSSLLTLPKPSTSTSDSSSAQSSEEMRNSKTNPKKPRNNSQSHSRGATDHPAPSTSRGGDIDHGSDSDRDWGDIPRKSNDAMLAKLVWTHGTTNVAFKLIRADREQPKTYLPDSCLIMGRAHLDDTETFLKGAVHSKAKLIIFEILPKETDDQKIFHNLVVYLHNRDRYGLVDYEPKVFCFYLFPVVRGLEIKNAFSIIGLKPKLRSLTELYGLIIKRGAPLPPKPVAIPPTPSSSRPSSSNKQKPPQFRRSDSSLSVDSNASSRVSETSETQRPGATNDFPAIDIEEITDLLNTTPDIISLTSSITALLSKVTDGLSIDKKAAATEECYKKVRFVMDREKRRADHRNRACAHILQMLNQLGASYKNSSKKSKPYEPGR